MSRCEKCGEWVDWDNPNIHYGGHICRTKQEEVDIKKQQQEQWSQYCQKQIGLCPCETCPGKVICSEDSSCVDKQVWERKRKFYEQR